MLPWQRLWGILKIDCMIYIHVIYQLTFCIVFCVYSSLQNALTGRLQWFARQLIAQHLHNPHSPDTDNSSSSITSHGSTSNSTSHTSCADWLLHLKNPLEILKTVVLPVIAQKPKVHSLLADINQSLELLNLA